MNSLKMINYSNIWNSLKYIIKAINNALGD